MKKFFVLFSLVVVLSGLGYVSRYSWSEVSTGPIPILNGGCCPPDCSTRNLRKIVSCQEGPYQYESCYCWRSNPPYYCTGVWYKTGTRRETVSTPCVDENSVTEVDCNWSCATIWDCTCCEGCEWHPSLCINTLIVSGSGKCDDARFCVIHPY